MRRQYEHLEIILVQQCSIDIQFLIWSLVRPQCADWGVGLLRFFFPADPPVLGEKEAERLTDTCGLRLRL